MNKNIQIDPNKIHFIPLGGSEQFGVNFNLYAYKNKWLAVDCGIGFATERFPGIDILLPDPSFIEERSSDLVGIIITHAHEDHIGALPYIWPRLRVPIYCSPFTATVLRKKFIEAPDCKEAIIHEVEQDEIISLGPFNTKFVHVSHSIPDTYSLLIETSAGNFVHSGDWNLDPTPVIGDATNDDAFQKFGDKGVLAYIGDSTNAEVSGCSGSEKDVEQGLLSVFLNCKGRIVITQFASNLSRIQSICNVAQQTERNVCIIGRSLHNMIDCAQDNGIFKNIPDFIPDNEIGYLPDNKVVFIVTGSQGEARAQLARIARGDHPDIKLGSEDTVIFSSRHIPGNETDINHVKNNLSARGVTIIEPKDTREIIHVSGHPCRDEIATMYQWIKPEIVVPVHGERTQLEAHAKFARNCQIKHVIVPYNGSVICLGPGKPEIVDHIETRLLALDSKRIIASNHASIISRRKLQYTGAIHISMVLDQKGALIKDPILTTVGIIDPEDSVEITFEKELVEQVCDILSDMQRQDRYNDHAVSEEVRIGIRRVVLLRTGLKAKTTVHVVRL